MLLPCLLALLAADHGAVQDEHAEQNAAEAEAAATASEPAASEPKHRVDQAAQAQRVLEVEAREAALRALELDLAAKIEELRKLKETTLAAIQAKEEAEAAHRATLVGFYQAMKPGAAAGLLEKLPLSLASEVLSSMKARQAGKILNVMEKSRAVQISKRMVGK
jgi:flagellar motility protein MotE (MotC chaperone)